MSGPAPLADPVRLPPENPATALPTEILLETRRPLTRKLLRAAWKPALVTIAVWYLLLISYVLSTSPLLWFTSVLFSLGEPRMLSMIVRSTGFRMAGLGLSFALLPVLATASSLALVPIASRRIAALQPRRFLSEDAFHRAVARRAAAPWIIPPLAVTGLLIVLVCCQVPLQWQDLSYGTLSGTAFGLGVLATTWPILCALHSAPRVLGLPTLAMQVRQWQLAHGDEKERRGGVLLAQDRRHLPPNDTRPSPGLLLRSLAVTALSSLSWVGIALVSLAWPTFLVADIGATWDRLVNTSMTDPSRTGLPWQSYLVLALALAGLAVIAALAPAIAGAAAAPLRAQTRDQRTPATWQQRAVANPWEARVSLLVGVINGVAALFAVAIAGLLSGLFGVFSAMDGTWIVLAALVLVPLYGVGAGRAMRRHLRYVIYGPADLYMRRPTPIALVAPAEGSRADRARDPEVRGEIRRRLQEQGADADPALLALDQGEESFWVDDALPGAVRQHSDAEAISRGELPDFGGGGAPEQESPHAIPDGLTGLQDVRRPRR